MQLSRASRGFSLLETLVAFSIAALALGVIFQIYAKGTTAVVLAGDYAQAIVIAESRLAESGVAGAAETAGTGETDNKFTWAVRRGNYVDDSLEGSGSPLRLLDVVVEVSWQDRGKTRSVGLHTLKPVVE